VGAALARYGRRIRLGGEAPAAWNFGPSIVGEDDSFFFRLHSRSAFVLIGDRAKYILDVVASDAEDPLLDIWNDIDLLGEQVSHIHFNHSLLVFSLGPT
jgi:hypothetical protein